MTKASIYEDDDVGLWSLQTWLKLRNLNEKKLSHWNQSDYKVILFESQDEKKAQWEDEE